MTSTRKTLLGAAAAMFAAGLGTAGSASAWSWGATPQTGPEHTVIESSGNTSINFTRNAMHDISI